MITWPKSSLELNQIFVDCSQSLSRSSIHPYVDLRAAILVFRKCTKSNSGLGDELGGGERNRIVHRSRFHGFRQMRCKIQDGVYPFVQISFICQKMAAKAWNWKAWILNDQKSRVPFRKLFENGTQRETPLLQLLILRVSVFETKMTGNGTTRSRRSYGRLGLFWDCEQSKVLKVYVTCKLECSLYSI